MVGAAAELAPRGSPLELRAAHARRHSTYTHTLLDLSNYYCKTTLNLDKKKISIVDSGYDVRAHSSKSLIFAPFPLLYCRHVT